jgi:hypothetical protein
MSASAEGRSVEWIVKLWATAEKASGPTCSAATAHKRLSERKL